MYGSDGRSIRPDQVRWLLDISDGNATRHTDRRGNTPLHTTVAGVVEGRKRKNGETAKGSSATEAAEV